MTLSDELNGADEPILEDREAWCDWLKQQHPDLRPNELLKEWNDRMNEVFDWAF